MRSLISSFLVFTLLLPQAHASTCKELFTKEDGNVWDSLPLPGDPVTPENPSELGIPNLEIKFDHEPIFKTNAFVGNASPNRVVGEKYLTINTPNRPKDEITVGFSSKDGRGVIKVGDRQMEAGVYFLRSLKIAETPNEIIRSPLFFKFKNISPENTQALIQHIEGMNGKRKIVWTRDMLKVLEKADIHLDKNSILSGFHRNQTLKDVWRSGFKTSKGDVIDFETYKGVDIPLETILKNITDISKLAPANQQGDKPSMKRKIITRIVIILGLSGLAWGYFGFSTTNEDNKENSTPLSTEETTFFIGKSVEKPQ